ncbi:TNF receptor-associated factor 6 [Eufriesea mexicana]|uniref:TNF receptor-associated factor 6 n=1 Tax=Eufriesea mexicana TaxID=516756 RepID=A0A310SB23_9HYME|nr:TNF receptor-associated factor 6 [Eufriesea mexicana]
MSSIVLLFLYMNTLYLTCCDASDANVSKLTIANINSTSDEGVTETQQATCKIATEELVASARASVTRVLTGTCNAKIIDEKLQTLEKVLVKELEEIKTLLYIVLEKKRALPKLYQSRSTGFFFYYWQINHFDEKLANWKTARSIRSSTFYVGQNGYAMYIKVTPRYFPDGTIFIGVGLTRGAHDSILEWPFPHKIRLEILDHSAEQSRQDRRSRIWDPSTLCSEYFWGRPKLTGQPDNPECVGLSVSRQVLFFKLPVTIDHLSRSTRYVWDGSITIKLTVYL